MDSPPGGWGVPSEIYRYKGNFQEIYRYKDQKPDLSFRGLSAPQARNFCDFEVEAHFFAPAAGHSDSYNLLLLNL